MVILDSPESAARIGSVLMLARQDGQWAHMWWARALCSNSPLELAGVGIKYQLSVFSVLELPEAILDLQNLSPASNNLYSPLKCLGTSHPDRDAAQRWRRCSRSSEEALVREASVGA